MSHLKTKSELNKFSADLLLKNNYFAPSVHCSYYRCIQLMLHVLFFVEKVDKSQFDEDRKKRKDGTHGHAIFLIQLMLAKKESEAFKSFQKLVPELKLLREKSDYENVEIKQEDGYEASTKADAIVNILTQKFKK